MTSVPWAEANAAKAERIRVVESFILLSHNTFEFS